MVLTCNFCESRIIPAETDYIRCDSCEKGIYLCDNDCLREHHEIYHDIYYTKKNRKNLEALGIKKNRM